MKKILFFAGLIAVTASGFYQYDKKITIYLEEYNYSFAPQKDGCADTLIEKLEDGRVLKIFLFECKGKMHLECYRNNRKTEEGEYVSSLDLLRKYSYGINGITGRKMIRVREYYQPLRSGVWFFYNKNGQLEFKKYYENGVLQ